MRLNANEIKIPCDRHHKVSSLVKSLQNTHSSVKDEVKSLHTSQVKSLHTSQVKSLHTSQVAQR